MGRLQAMHLAVRLPPERLADAAYCGLQDSAPRAGLLSLHARVEGIGPDSWEDERLAQVWGPRQAVWLVPSDAVAAFTIGRLPRDAAKVRAIERIAEAALGGAPDPARRVGAMTGRFLVRWDARTTTLVPVDPPQVDPEDARRDLARRYLTWFGDTMRGHFASWAGIDEGDARETMRHVRAPALPDQPPAEGVRFLPMFDPYLYRRPALRSGHREVVGALLVDGRMAGTWARQARRVTVRPRRRVHLDRVEDAAREMSGPLGGPVRVTIAPPQEEA